MSRRSPASSVTNRARVRAPASSGRRDQQAGRLASARTDLEITITTREAERHELERGRDAADKQAGGPQRADGGESPPPPSPVAPQTPRPLDASQDAPVIDAASDAQRQQQERQQEQGQSGPAPGGDSGGPSPDAPASSTAQRGATAQEQARESNLPPFEPPAPEGYFIGHSRERNDRFFKPIEDVERIKAEQDLCERYKAEVTEAEKAVAYQRERADEEMKKLGLDKDGIDEFRKNEFDLARDQLNMLHQDQKQQLKDVHALTQVADETMRAEQARSARHQSGRWTTTGTTPRIESARGRRRRRWRSSTRRISSPMARDSIEKVHHPI